ncbi:MULTISPECIES: S8 family peptidase [Streptomyces]|uniref:S8 family peptidase n=1 Tax=Streptomyces TaxID=1883 RepID=UPI000DFD5AA5|nr:MULTISPECIES: S8 family peptidase [Streptomyces]MBT3076574.1 S8 family peptidase [Streptomyces sp. COG21]MBT3078911.1 S8 family peptidase [Streptomyces sp. COG20]MBT3087781.1 S8 family peptidase [Streptomyces sp. CYG21]MBT3096516.1 S8 family peptidase [Streptomyces sp. CBG30]MBT3107223.1 S8 family peptidase [Streptomyces sp. COG19]
MSGERNFLLGHGERLVKPVQVRPGGGETKFPYTSEEALERLRPQLETTVRELDALPLEACPGDKAVGIITLHPQFIAKMHHPGTLLRESGLSYVGSRGASVIPEKWTRQGEPSALDTTELFVAGKRENFSAILERWSNGRGLPEKSQIRMIESLRAPAVSDKKRGTASAAHGMTLFEVGLHLPSSDSERILRSFARYAESCGAHAEMERRIPVSGLVFMPVNASLDELDLLSKFAFLRVVRPMPKLRTMHPVERSMTVQDLSPTPLPLEGPIDPSIRMAIFDGGLPCNGPLAPWARSFDAAGVGPELEECLEHGHMVTSAALFGSLRPGKAVARPFNSVDHYRILDGSAEESYSLYNTLERIRDVLEEKNYDFVNLSLGPELPIEDDEVHPWTAVLDEYLADGRTFLSVAAGNNGQQDRPSGNARIQIPSDCVNALAVGSANSAQANWDRAEYSAMGPGRSPGMVKPDLLSFGGSSYEPFHFASRDNSGKLKSAMGTSFASPAALRMAAGIRAHFGGHIKPLALRALLVHCAERGGVPIDEAGWGRIPDEIEEFVVCPQNSVRILYQGSIDPGQTVRMPIPFPEEVTEGMVSVSATYCISTTTDSRTPSTYTGSAIEPVFRPHAERFSKDDSIRAATRSFFQDGDYVPEDTLRKRAHKWETTKHKSIKLRASSLLRPVFDVRHVSRAELMAGEPKERTDYALVISLSTSKDSDIYNKVVRAYSGSLEILQPQVDVPISVRPQR